MKILVLTKRQYMGMDLLDDRFGRFRELPLELTRLGHEVRGLAVSYRPRPCGVSFDRDPGREGTVIWQSVNLLDAVIPRVDRLFRSATNLLRDFKPDVIWATSDAYMVILGSWAAKFARIPCVVDIYDNFECFGASKVPGLISLFKHAVRQVEGITCFSDRMREHSIHCYSRAQPITIVENGQRDDFFYPQQPKPCRVRLGLPQQSILIGTAGALDHSRGIETLFSAFERLEKKYGDLHLAVAGPRSTSLRIPKSANIHDLQILPHALVASFVNALDVAVICYKHSAQGEVSFPQKAYEIIACRVPFVAADVGSMKELLERYPECLYEPENPDSLAQAIERQLRTRRIVEIRAPSWRDSAKQLELFFESVLAQNTSALASSLN